MSQGANVELSKSCHTHPIAPLLLGAGFTGPLMSSACGLLRGVHLVGWAHPLDLALLPPKDSNLDKPVQSRLSCR